MNSEAACAIDSEAKALFYVDFWAGMVMGVALKPLDLKLKFFFQ